MSILNGYLHLFEPIELRGLRLPIEYFFRSLADDQHERSIGVILSGMGSDGSLGLKALEEKNGIVVVQDPLTAKFDGMPKSAVNSVIVDIMASASDLIGTNKEVVFQNEEKEELQAELNKARELLKKHNLYRQ